MKVELLYDSLIPDWNRFVESHNDCWHYHLIQWKNVIEKSYGHKCYYLLARDCGDIKAILPLVLIKSALFGNSLTSLPFLDFSGLVSHDDDAEEALIKRASEIGRSEGADYIEMRQIKPLRDENLQTLKDKVTITLGMTGKTESLWKSLPSERRNRIRKAEKSGLRASIENADKLTIFYKIWTENMRDLGSPAHSFRFFQNIMDLFGERSKLLLVKYEDNFIGGAVCLLFKGRLAVPWVSSLRKYFKLYPNNILYWQAMKLAIDSGCETFDFGRSSVDSGTYKFKVRWGGESKPLFWQFKILAANKSITPAPSDPRFRLARKIWTRLPVGISRTVGPLIRKYITS